MSTFVAPTANELNGSEPRRVLRQKPETIGKVIRRATPASVIDLKGCSLALIYETLDQMIFQAGTEVHRRSI
jgi:hypothetical protein